jgi:hypothetical protein
MKCRPVVRAQLSCSVLFLVAAPTASAEDHEGCLEWKPIPGAEGIEVIRLWEHLDPRPDFEHALLRVTDAWHDELLRDPGAFVNRHEIFPKPIQPLSACSQQARSGAPADTTVLHWMVDIGHWPDSGALCYSFLLWMPPETE